MAVMTSSNNTISLLIKIQQKYPTVAFVKDTDFYWSSKDQSVHTGFKEYSEIEYWTLFHEIAHCLLKHESFGSDYELLKMELEAWEKAKPIARQFKNTISHAHIEDCLDTYRDWLHKRSLCSQCNTNGIQMSPNKYRCITCNGTWRVTQKQSCRVYRIQKDT